MLFLQLVLLAVLLPEGDSEDDSQEPVSFRVIRTSSLYNRSWTQNQGSVWLDDVQIHAWDNKNRTFVFRWPWAQGDLSNEERMEADQLFYSNYIFYNLVYHDHVSQWQLEYPFQVQMEIGCELRIGEPFSGFMRYAYQGTDLIHFQNTSWRPSPKGGSRAQQASSVFNQYHEDNEFTHELITGYCPRYVLSLLDVGKADLQRQVRPEAWLSSWTQPWAWPSAAGVPRLRLLPQACAGVLGCESQGGSWPVLPCETQQSRRPGHGPPLGAAPLRGLGLPGGDRAPGAPGRPGVVALEALESPLETSVHGLPFGAGTQQPKLQHLPKPSSALTSWPLPVANSSLVLLIDLFSVSAQCDLMEFPVLIGSVS
uniref:MHC class I-like antigen recognition-like domain-containing protein n=1 Tax=Canis lupus familiaris TaxID=9615 RepID=A0A8C0NEN9_CANLF